MATGWTGRGMRSSETAACWCWEERRAEGFTFADDNMGGVLRAACDEMDEDVELVKAGVRSTINLVSLDGIY